MLNVAANGVLDDTLKATTKTASLHARLGWVPRMQAIWLQSYVYC